MNGASWNRISDSSFPSCRGLGKEILEDRKRLSSKASWTPQGVINLQQNLLRNELQAAQERGANLKDSSASSSGMKHIVARKIRLLNQGWKIPQTLPCEESLLRLKSQKGCSLSKRALWRLPSMRVRPSDSIWYYDSLPMWRQKNVVRRPAGWKIMSLKSRIKK